MNRVNPISNIMAASMMMDYLGESEAAVKIEKAITDVLAEGKVLTADLGGTATTSQIADAIAKRAREL